MQLSSRVLPSTAQLQGVIFDMDGVIIDSHPSHCLAWKEFLAGLGKEVGNQELSFVLDGRKRNEILSHFLGPLTEAQLLQYGRLKDEIFRSTAAKITTIPGVSAFIESLHSSGISLAVATSASAGRTRTTLDRLQLSRYFSAIVTGDDVRHGKPHPDIYQIACEKINSPTTKVIAIEDAPSGVRAAKTAGLKCLTIAGSQSREALLSAGADCVIDSFVDLSLSDVESLMGTHAEPDLSAELREGGLLN